ncbi:hypothetical protein MCOR25_010366 [Pyricularia grisea]|nr:hypothetical protein MCOR25_010366 [Pyricularia grisea]
MQSHGQTPVYGGHPQHQLSDTPGMDPRLSHERHVVHDYMRGQGPISVPSVGHHTSSMDLNNGSNTGIAASSELRDAATMASRHGYLMGHGPIFASPNLGSVEAMTGQHQFHPSAQQHLENHTPHQHQHHQYLHDREAPAHHAAMSMAPSSGPAPGNPKPIRRRMRMITSCLECRRRKLKCDKSNPCANCTKFNRECLYLGAKLDEASQHRLTEIKEKAGALERQLERSVARSASRSYSQQRIVVDDVEDEYADERELEATPMVALDLTYDDPDVEHTTDDIIDLGIQVGKMRITERIGGLNRPRISEEIEAGLSASPPQTLGYDHMPGQTSRADSISAANGSEIVIPDFLRPGTSYIPPTSGYFFGQVVQSPSLEQLLPSSRGMGDVLLQRYYDAVHPIARCVHWPSFEQTYQSFWDDCNAGYEPRPSVQAVVFAAWFSAAVSLEHDGDVRMFGESKAALMQKMKIGTEAALSKANFLRTTRVETLQAFIMYMIPLCRAEISRAHSVLVGAAVRMAECMGLHRDGEAYGLTPLETHVRRLLWHQLCFLDVRTCEAQGPKPAIRREDYDTSLPLNCEEEDLTNAIEPPSPAERWTSALLPLMRFEINEMMRNIWMDRRRLESHKTTVTNVLQKIGNFRKRLLEKYERFLDDRVPIQRYAKLVMHLLTHRLYAMILHPYYANTSNPMPPRLNSVLIWGGVGIIEISIQLETNPDFAPWSWYLGAYQQYQIALLLATEIYYRPANKEADRIWACLDHVFGMERNLSRDEKGALILHEIAEKTSIYMGMRKMRAPRSTTEAVPDKQPIKTEGSVSPSAAVLAAAEPYNHQPAQNQNHQPHHQENEQQSTGQPNLQYSPPLFTQNQSQHRHHHQHSPGSFKIEPGIPSTMMPTAPITGTGGIRGAPMSSQTGIPMHIPPGPPQNVVFAGVSNGEVLWSLPPQNPGSPEASSDGGSVAGHPQRSGQIPAPPGGGAMCGIDWAACTDAINAIFPSDPQTGEFSMNVFVDPNVGMKWSS